MLNSGMNLKKQQKNFDDKKKNSIHGLWKYDPKISQNFKKNES